MEGDRDEDEEQHYSAVMADIQKGIWRTSWVRVRRERRMSVRVYSSGDPPSPPSPSWASRGFHRSRSQVVAMQSHLNKQCSPSVWTAGDLPGSEEEPVPCPPPPPTPPSVLRITQRRYGPSPSPCRFLVPNSLMNAKSVGVFQSTVCQHPVLHSLPVSKLSPPILPPLISFYTMAVNSPLTYLLAYLSARPPVSLTVCLSVLQLSNSVTTDINKVPTPPSLKVWKQRYFVYIM